MSRRRQPRVGWYTSLREFSRFVAILSHTPPTEKTQQFRALKEDDGEYGKALAAVGFAEVQQPCDDDGVPMCPICLKRELQMVDNKRHLMTGDRHMVACSCCGLYAHELCGGAYEHAKNPLCVACGRDDQSDGEEAICVDQESSDTPEDDDSSLGSLKDFIEPESDEEGEEEEVEEDEEEEEEEAKVVEPVKRRRTRLVEGDESTESGDVSKDAVKEVAKKPRIGK